jgi:hypothetical protein
MIDQYHTQQTSETYKALTLHSIIFPTADAIKNTPDRNYARYTSDIPHAHNGFMFAARESSNAHTTARLAE